MLQRSRLLAYAMPMTLLVVAGVAVIVGLLWPLTDLIAAHDVGLIAGPQQPVGEHVRMRVAAIS